MIIDTKNETTRKRRGESGVGMAELVIVVAIIAVLSTVAIINFRTARASLSIQNSVRQLASYMEKARIDAVRRHSTTSVKFTSRTSYTVNMDFLNNGTPTSRSYDFESGVQIANNAALPEVTFNWRGRTLTSGTSCVTTFAVNTANGSGQPLNVDVSGSGDVTVENQQPVLPNVPYNNGILPSSAVRTATIVSGTDTLDGTPCLDVSGEGVGGEAGPPQCTIHVSSTTVSVKKNGGETANVLVSLSVTSGVVVSKPSNLTITPTSQTVSTGSNFAIKSNNTLRGPFIVTFSAQCGTTFPITVNVTN